MEATLTWQDALNFVCADEKGRTTRIEVSSETNPSPQTPSPLQVMLHGVIACTATDVVEILQKRRKSIAAFGIEATVERAEDHPRVFKALHLVYKLKSENATARDLEIAINLSLDKYCSATGTLRLADVAITWEAVLTP